LLYGFSLDVKERIRQSINIVDLVGEYVQLQPKGRVYVGLCPWHDDSKPSLQVDPERQTFRCWVCADGGDIFSFMMKIENVSFPEALQMLADRAGIELPKLPRKHHSRPFNSDFSSARGSRNGSSDSENGTDSPNDADSTHTQNGQNSSNEPDYSTFSGKKALYQAAGWAETQYHEFFKSLPDSHPARVYLTERGISPENVDKFRIGFAPDEKYWLERRANRRSALLKDLTTTGYLAQSQGGKSLYERFRGRLLFPIHDAQGRSVGIGGRVIPGVPTSNESAKYLNTPETPLFSKHRLLYGLDLARQSIRSKKRVLVMEGYTDTIIAHQYGFTEAVAVLGTALGLDHIRILNRLADQIFLILDGDEPGQKRAAQVLELFVAEKVDVRILTLPEEDDPAEFLADYGAEKFEELIQTQATDALTHAFQLYTKGLDYTNIHQSERAMDKLLGLIASGTLKNGENDFGTLSFREEKMLQQLAFSFSISEDFLRRRLKEIRGKALHDAQMRERWQSMREQEEETQEQFLLGGVNPSAGVSLSAGASPSFGESPEGPTTYNESEAYSDGDESFYDDSIDPAGLPERVPAKRNGIGNSGVSSRPGSGLESGLNLGQDSTGESEPIDYAAEPTLLTREAFDLHADEVDWRIFGRMNAWEKEIVEILLVWPGLLSEVRKHTTPERFLYVPAREFFLRMCEMADEGKEPDFEKMLTEFESQKMKSWLVQMEMENIWNRESKSEAEVQALLEPIMANFALFHLNSRKPQDLSVFNSVSLDREQKISLLAQLIQETQRKNGIQPVSKPRE